MAVVFARIVQKKSTDEDLGLSFGKVLRPEEIDWVGGALGEEEDEDDSDEDAKQSFDLLLSALFHNGDIMYICTHKKKPLPPSKTTDASHLEAAMIQSANLILSVRTR